MMKMMKSSRLSAAILPLLLLIFIALPLSAGKVYTPAEVPNVNKVDRREFVSDPAGLMSPDARGRVNATLGSLRERTTAEVAVVVVPSIGDLSPEEFSEKVFTSWGIGKSDRDNGLLFLIVPDDRVARIETGYGLEGVLPDAVCSRIIRESVAPSMKSGDLDGAVTAATAAIARILTDPAAADEIRSAQRGVPGQSGKGLDVEVFLSFIWIVAGAAFIFSLALFCHDLWKGRRRDGYEKSQMWRSHLTVYWIAAACSLGAGLLTALLALFVYWSTRNRRRKCRRCGAKMKKLSEEADNEFLTPPQDLEERLGTVDYDVWECPKCGEVERFPFKEKQSKYGKCPSCGTVAEKLVCDRVLRRPTTRTEGEGERVYECLFCHHQRRQPYRIPRKPDEAAAAAALLGAAAASSRRHGGGGGFGGGLGGGFGGGSTGGGGATGSW